MKYPIIILFLFVGLLAQEVATPAAHKHPPINHIFQGKGNGYCASACVLMALQRITPLNLNDQKLLPTFSGMYKESSSTPRGLTNAYWLSEILGLSPRLINYNISGSSDIESNKAALDKLKKDIIPTLDKGGLVLLAINHRPGVHYILLTSFNHETKRFVVHDPLEQKSTEWSLNELAKLWPVTSNGKLLLYGAVLNIPAPSSNVLLDPPQSLELTIRDDVLSEYLLPQGVLFPKSNREFTGQKFAQVIPRANVVPVNTLWEKGRKADDVKGIPLWLKVKVAQGDPACLFFSKPDGSKKIVAVTGYRGGYKNFEGEMQITEIGDDGKLVKSWMKSAEVLLKGKSQRECGGDSFYIIYPKKPLVDTDDAKKNKNDTK